MDWVWNWWTEAEVTKCKWINEQCMKGMSSWKRMELKKWSMECEWINGMWNELKWNGLNVNERSVVKRVG